MEMMLFSRSRFLWFSRFWAVVAGAPAFGSIRLFEEHEEHEIFRSDMRKSGWK
jgi:hypothetical protein